MKINTSRFGEIEATESAMLLMKGAILGFERHSRYVLLTHDPDTPLWWLQSVDDPDLAFVVVDPWVVKPDYDPAIDEEDLAFLHIQDRKDMILLAIVTVRSNPFRLTANLRAPILVHATGRTANQVILNDPAHPIQYDVIANRTTDMGLSEGCGGREKPGRLAVVATPA